MRTVKVIDMTKIYSNKNYKGKWVAVENYKTKPEVVASGKNLKKVVQEAEQKGFKLPLIMQIPKEVLPIVGPYTIFR